MGLSVCRVGVVGVGTVGAGVIHILLKRPDLLARRSGVRLQLTKVAELDRARALAEGVPEEILVDDFAKITGDPEIDIVVELIGGMGVAEKVVSSALEAGKSVVTANKALLAEKGAALFALARKKDVALAFEAAVCGGIPIILALREGLIANHILSLTGIVNGTCNYILSKMTEEGAPFDKCLAEAQKLGYAEADPTFDIDGIDSGHKLALLSALALESWIDFPGLHIEGIRNINLMDVEFARYLGYTVKLLAVARPQPETGKVFLSVHPALLHLEHPLANVHGSMNAIALEGDVVKEAMFYGRGAGREPTASAVVSDIVSVARDLCGNTDATSWTPRENPMYALAPMAQYRARYYLRIIAEDIPGVLGRVMMTLGNNNVSIASVHQFESELDNNRVPISILTHQALEGEVLKSLAEIDSFDFIHGQPVFIRIEG
jgi:homoserine dehydrogenase